MCLWFDRCLGAISGALCVNRSQGLPTYTMIGHMRKLTLQPRQGLCHPASTQARIVSTNAVATPAVQLKTWGQQNTEAEAHEQLNYAAEFGVNFVDTAEMYPIVPTAENANRTSIYIGHWLRSKRREDFVIATKVAGRSQGLQWIPANRTDPPGKQECPKLDGHSIIAAAEAELRRLQTDYIDLLQLHWPDRYVPTFGHNQYQPELAAQRADFVPFEGQVEALGTLIRQGKIRAWGLSNETSYGTMRFCQVADALGVPRPATIQNMYCLAQRTFDGELAEVCAPYNMNIGLLPWSALAGGSLTGKYLNGKVPAGSRFSYFGERYKRFNSPRVQKAVVEYMKIAKEAGLTPAQLGYAFCRSRWFIPSTIIGATSMEQLRENLVAFGPAGELSDDILAMIDKVHAELRNPILVD